MTDASVIEAAKKCGGMSPELTAALERIKGYVMSPEEVEAQRQSWVRAFAPCEHGEVDFETCPGCIERAHLATQAGSE